MVRRTELCPPKAKVAGSNPVGHACTDKLTHPRSTQMPNISFEFFPPASYLNFLKLLETQKKLSVFSPRFVSITSGSQGAKEHFDAVVASTKFFRTVAPHFLSGTGNPEVVKLSGSYSRAGISQVVILRGDRSGLPSFNCWDVSEAIQLIRTEWGNTFLIDVAAYPDGHPKSATERCDLTGLSAKIVGGASSSIAQYSFSPDSFFSKVSKLRNLGIRTPISPGVMVSSSPNLLGRMTKFCGSDAPLWVRRRCENFLPDGQLTRQLCVEVTSQLCENLVGCGMSDLHFYTLNDYRLVREVCCHIGDRPLEFEIFPSEIVQLGFPSSSRSPDCY